MIVAGDSLIFRRSEKMIKMREQRPCGSVPRCRPTSRRRDRSWMECFGAEDKRKVRFYSRANGEKNLQPRAEARAMKRKCK